MGGGRKKKSAPKPSYRKLSDTPPPASEVQNQFVQDQVARRAQERANVASTFTTRSPSAGRGEAGIDKAFTKTVAADVADMAGVDDTISKSRSRARNPEIDMGMLAMSLFSPNKFTNKDLYRRSRRQSYYGNMR